MVQPAVTRAAKGQAVLLLVGTVFVVGKIGLFELGNKVSFSTSITKQEVFNRLRCCVIYSTENRDSLLQLHMALFIFYTQKV